MFPKMLPIAHFPTRAVRRTHAHAAREGGDILVTSTFFRRWKLRRPFAVSLVLLSGAIGAAVIALEHPAARDEQTPPPLSPKRFTHERQPIDESGFALACSFALASPSYDPTSLESIRAAFDHAGNRRIQALRSQRPSSQYEELNRFVKIALLHGYEGDFAKASAVLAEARALADRDPVRFDAERPTLIFLQGVMALRRGEEDNCVACPCCSSCILPLQPEAFHQNRSGSLEAVKHFTEYLEGRPDDLGVRWLLNVAYMTLGSYPEGVPPRYRLPLEPLASEFDIGRFRDLAPRLGLDRLHRSGGAIMDDFDNDGWLDLFVGGESVPSRLYHNFGRASALASALPCHRGEASTGT
jgi:hypothetical protein